MISEVWKRIPILAALIDMKMPRLTATAAALALVLCGGGKSDAQIYSIIDAVERQGEDAEHRGDNGELGDDEGSCFDRIAVGAGLTPP